MSTAGSSRPHSGTVHFTAYTDNDGPDTHVILAGAVGDYGTGESVTRDGSVDPDHRHQLELKLAHGTFRLDIAALDQTFVNAMTNLAVDTTSCSATAAVSGQVPIVAGAGTGAYRGITGTLTLTMTLDEVYPPEHCAETAAYLAQTIVITGTGTVAFT